MTTEKNSRAPHQKRKQASDEPHQGQPFTVRADLAQAVRAVAMHRLWSDYGIPWHAIEGTLSTMIRNVVKIPIGSNGRGRKPDVRARFVWQMERKDLVGAALCEALPEDEYEKLRGIACTKTELALLWLLVFGIDDVPGVKKGLTADAVIRNETLTMHRMQSSDRHGYPDMWSPVPLDSERKGDRVVDLGARGTVRMRKHARKPRGHRPPE